jgi:hypothetical protein
VRTSQFVTRILNTIAYVDEKTNILSFLGGGGSKTLSSLIKIASTFLKKEIVREVIWTQVGGA